jgi:hypothetical protein
LIAPAQTASGCEVKTFSLGQASGKSDGVPKLIEEVNWESYGTARSNYLEHSKSELKNWLTFEGN